MDFLISSSLIAAFLAGVAALFAPCCITVLLPTYLASIFRERRAVFFMTFIFFLGVLTVFLPLGFGMGGLGQLLNTYHKLIFGVGSVLLLFFGFFILTGKHFSMNLSLRPVGAVQGAGSVYMLGLFSGISTICCAPVLAGALALSLLPGSFFWGGMYSLVYVLGMVLPLFVIAFFIDQTKATKKLTIFRKQIQYSLAGATVRLRIADLLSGVTFVAMGALTLYLALTDKLSNHSMYQTRINLVVAGLTETATRLLGNISWIVWLIVVALVLVGVGTLAIRKRQSSIVAMPLKKGGDTR